MVGFRVFGTPDFQSPEVPIRKGRTWAIAVRRGSCKSVFLLNSGHYFPKKVGNPVLNFGSHKMV